ncbi:PREDICTED: multidrug resistance-associated protein 4-like isoform X1 [Vollenhovia emeryi]|uniref:multidrug resistance-associated protein 4-like isoform X1 n=1 Tax=Vollenhovia emeryi TaxID=411798 RepID=UPI0005F4BFB8|nr:PREDICTED: multidrug resistance-associated protein 4-like isoform X1 [Vollenhovia emeryi]
MDKDTTEMKSNPRETANVFSILFFWWMRELFMKGIKRDLEESDIYRPVKADESEKLTDHLEKCWNHELDKLKNLEYTVGKDGQKVPLKRDVRPRLYKAIVNAFWLPYFIIGTFVFIQCNVVRVAIPIFQSWIIDYFAQTSKYKTETDDVLIYIACMVLCNIISVLIMHHTMMQSMQIGMRIRVSCSSLLYRKLLRLNRASMNQTGTGQIMNLLSNDVTRFDQLTQFVNYIWIMPVQIVIIGSIMWEKLGYSVLVGIGSLLIIALVVQGIFSLLSRRIRAMIAPQTDRRVQLMSELVAGIQVVKMYAWEKPFSKIVSLTRQLEIKKIQFSSYVRAAYLAIIVFTERLTLYFTLITFVLTGHNLTADLTYEMSTYFNMLQLTTAMYFPQALIQLGEAMVSMSRLEDLLLMDEVNMERSEKTPQLQRESQNPNEVTDEVNQTDRYISKNGSMALSELQRLPDLPVCVKLQRVSANWINGQLPPTLCNINLTIKPGQLCAVVGTVGSGKSSILHLLLKELDPGAGTVSLIQDSSKDNFQSKMSNGYFMSNPNLRISYASQEPWLFGGTVRDNILFGQPYDKARYTQVANVCALTKDFRQFPQGDMTLVGDRGVSLSGGQRARINLARAVYRQANLYLLDDPLSAVDSRVGRHLYWKCISEYLHGKTRILVTHQLQFLKRADYIVVLDRGFVKMQGSYTELVQSNRDFIRMLDNLSHEAQKKEEDMRRASEMSMKRISIMRRASGLSVASSTVSEIDDSDYAENSPEAEMMAHGRISGKVYKEYLHHGASYFSLFMLLLLFIISQVATSGTDYWLSYWTSLEDVRRVENTSDVSQYAYLYNNSFLGSIFTLNPDGLLSTEDAIYVYTFCIISCTVTTLLRSFLYMKVCMNSSCNLHNTMFSNLLQARMTFFHTNPTGRILNRFSKDMGTMDELLPKAMLEALQVCCVVCGILVMETILNPWMLIAIVILAVVFYFMTKFYLSTAQNVKRLEGVTKSPLFSHVNATLNGLPTIRSSGAGIETMMRKQFDVLQDRHSGTWYLFITCGTTFGVFTDLIMCLFLATLCYSLVFLNENGGVADSTAGLAISQSLILIGCLQYGIKQSTETMSLMTSVERVLQYTNLPQEKPITSDNPPPPTWPSQGQLVLKDVSMKYHKDDPPVLKNLNVSIEPGWKVGVVGRTGAGKSSLISALFRLFNEGLEGEIKIDDWDTSTVGLGELRCKISIIPQEPVLFSESLRYNLDPFNQYDDMKLWDVLRQVELNDVALDHDIFYGGHNFSVGQRQLICLARAILRNNRLLVLDEATANIDSHTDALIQDTIRSIFKECTVITIAHRLNTIIDSDRIIVMENGSIVEFGCPYELLHEKPNGYFSQMVQKTGNQMAQSLLEQARTACVRNNDHRELNLSGQNTEGESDATITEQSAL